MIQINKQNRRKICFLEKKRFFRSSFLKYLFAQWRIKGGKRTRFIQDASIVKEALEYSPKVKLP
jgi:hypothetical protein